MTDTLTHVELLWLEDRVERWIRFGAPAQEEIIDRRRRIVAFAPGTVFAFVRWASNDHGTVVSRLDILRAQPPGAAITTLPYVRPGAESLLRVFGWTRTQVVLQVINDVEQLGLDPAAVADDYWRHVHNRVVAGQSPRPYSRSRHGAWLLRQRLAP
ncbi:glycosidase [Caulobacter vibrioides]|nr:glycosidase [Caulobacter vibrioides]